MILIPGNLHTARLVIGVVLAALVFGTLGGLMYLQTKIREVDAATGAQEVAIRVTAPGNRDLYNGTVTVENATAYAALVRAGEVARFSVETRDYPNGLYVYSIGGYAASGSSGWVYEVTRDGEAQWGDRASNLYALAAGDFLHWRWSDAPPESG